MTLDDFLTRHLFKKEWEIRKQLWRSFGCLSGSAVIIMVLVAVIVVAGIGSTARSRASEALEEQITRNMITTAEEAGAVINQKFEALQEGIVTTLALAANDVVNDEVTDGAYPLTRPETEYSFELTEANTEAYSSMQITNVANQADLDALTLSNRTRKHIDYSAHLDPYFKRIRQENPEVALMYLGFSRTAANEPPLYRYFPGGGSQTNVEFDTGTRPWHIAAMEDRDSVHISDLYLDAAQGLGWVITFSKAVEAPQNAAIGIDVQLDEIQTDILAISDSSLSSLFAGSAGTSLESFFAALISVDENGRTLVIAHPDWDQDSTEPQPLSAVEPALSTENINAIVNEESGFFEYERNGEVFFMGHASFFDGSYVALVFVSRDEALAPVPELNRDINASMGLVIGCTIAAGAVALALALLGVRRIAVNISRPLKRVMEASNEVTRADDDDSDEVRKKLDELKPFAREPGADGADEISVFVHKFLQMLEALKQKREIAKAKPKYPENPFNDSDQKFPWESDMFEVKEEENSDANALDALSDDDKDDDGFAPPQKSKQPAVVLGDGEDEKEAKTEEDEDASAPPAYSDDGATRRAEGSLSLSST